MIGLSEMERPARFRPRHRIGHAREFAAVYAARLKKLRGPLIVWACVTDRAEPRLGLAIGRRVGSAVERNAIKRRLREAFRLAKEGFPKPPNGGAYDVVIGARPHDRMRMDAYQVLLVEAVGALHREFCRRHRRGGDEPEPSSSE